MNQTFYIDIDEEISSVIDRLNKSMAMENFFVVPKRALFLQSIVNLKLLKREAEKSGKHVVLVTQDEIGTSMAQRSGIDVRPSLEGLESTSDLNSESPEDEDLEDKDVVFEEPKLAEKTSQDKQIRLSSIGSREFYDSLSESDSREKEVVLKKPKSAPRRLSINSMDPMSYPASNTEKKAVESFLPEKTLQAQAYKKSQSQPNIYKSPSGINYDIYQKEPSLAKKNDSRRENTLNKLFSPSRDHQSNSGQAANNVPKKREGRAKKIFFGFVILCILLFAGVAAYLFLPKAEIIIVPNILKNKVDFNIHGAVDAQADTISNIPIRVIDQTQDISQSYDATGKSSVSGKKAHGSVVIYNEYDSSSQPLIATTRFESPDGKIFRLVKNIVVPGMTVVGGSQQPGAIEAEVVADQAGSDYNIDANKFTIPGFAGGPKFDKFYAKSSASFVGGSSDGDSGGSGAISQQDIDNAKMKTEAALNEKIKNEINSQLQTGEVALPEAEKITVTKSAADAKIGDVSSSLSYTATATVRALVFSEEDVKKIILSNQQKTEDVQTGISKIEYGSVDPNFDNPAVDLKVHSEITMTPNIDVQQIKKEILGKNSDQLSDILSRYSSIKNASANFWPSFISRIPQYSQRITVKIDESSQ
jgi:hypothetical protein